MLQKVDSKFVMRFRWIIFIFIVICIIIGTYGQMQYKKYKLKKNGVEVIGIVTGEHTSFIMGSYSHYEFESNGYIYTGVAPKPENVNIDDSVYITFLPDNPNSNNLSVNLE
ncbi:MAG: hypothetical protein LBR46_08580 [Prevotella sp.]|nr:hypothetical protein [Prevotella sp.]